MTQVDRWLLPDGVTELLPNEALKIEQLRRQLLDLYYAWGYDLVIPPMVEFLESLLPETWDDLDLQTFKITDQLTGRLMGIRADFTPQVSRIDAHCLQQEGPVRLCYCGSVLHTKPSFASSRSPIQVGAELYGHAGIDSDIEIISLLLETLGAANVSPIQLDLGHVGIYRQLAHLANLNNNQERELSALLQTKAFDDIKTFITQHVTDTILQQLMIELPYLNGDSHILEKAKTKLQNFNPEITHAIDNLIQINHHITNQFPEVKLYFDLSELRGYYYHTGIVFAAYTDNQGFAIAQGGRYDDVGRVFGRARPATGFSADLKSLVNLSKNDSQQSDSIFALCDNNDASFWDEIKKLRREGKRIIIGLPDQAQSAKDMGCNKQLVKHNNKWSVETV